MNTFVNLKMKGKMKLNNTSKFDIDLKYGQVREKRVAELLSNDKVEIKTERSWWRKTGNIAIIGLVNV